MIAKELLFEEIFNNAHDAIMISKDENGILHYIEVNEAACKRLGYSREELLQLGPKDTTAPQYRDQYEMVKKKIETEKTMMLSWAHITKDGKIIPVEDNIQYFEMNDMKLCIVIARDITHHKELENELRARNEQLINMKNYVDKAIDISNIMVCHLDLLGHFIKVSPRYCQMLGYSEEELLSMTCKNITHPAYVDKDIRMYRQLIEKKIETYEIEKPYITKAGSLVWVYLNCSVVTNHEEEPLYILAYVKNIDQQKHLERELKEKSNQIRQYQRMIKVAEETAGIFIGTVGIDGIIKEVNDVVCQQLGYSEDELKKMTFLEITHPVDLKKEEVFIKQMQKGEITAYKIEKRMIHKKGGFVWVYAICSLMKDQNDVATGILIHAYDISHRKRLEEQLLKSYHEYQKLIDFFPQAIFIMKDGKYLYINEAGKKMLGVQDNTEYKGKSFLEFLHPEYHQDTDKKKKMIDTKKMIPMNQYKVIQKNGKIIEIESTSTTITYHQQEVVLTIAIDVTEAKKSAIHLQRLNEQLKLYIEEKDQLIIELRKFRHNYLNILHGMNGYIEEVNSVELKDYFYSALHDLEKLKSSNILSIQKIKNHELRYFLTDKIREAQKNHVDLQIHVENDILIWEELIKTEDLCQVLSIYLNEAIKEAKHTSKKRIIVGIFDDMEYMCVFVENTCEQKHCSVSNGINPAHRILDKYQNILQNFFIEKECYIRELHIQKNISR